MNMPSAEDAATAEQGAAAGRLATPEVLQAAIDAADGMVTIADVRDPDHPLLYVNGGFENFTGYKAGEVLGENCRLLQIRADGRRDDGTLGLPHDELQAEGLQRIRSAIRDGTRATVVLRNYRKGGAAFWNELILSPVHDATGEYVAVAGVQHDVTRRIEAEARVTRQAETVSRRLSELEGAFAAAPVGIATLDLNLRLLRANREMDRLLGAATGTPDELDTIDDHAAGPPNRGAAVDGMLNLPLAAVCPPTLWGKVEPMLLRAAQRGEAGEATVVSPADESRTASSGEDALLLCSVRPILSTGANAVPLAINLAVQDVTDIRRGERLLREANERLDAARVSAERAKERAEKATRAKDEFLAVLSHELRTPLTPVVAGVQLVTNDLAKVLTELDAAGDGEVRAPALTEAVRSWIDILATVRRNADLESRLIDDLLDVTRIARGDLRLTISTTPLIEAARHAVSICTPDARRKNITLRGVDAPGDGSGPQVAADPVRLRQIVWNLVGNAVKYTPSGGTVSVEVADRNGRGVVVVRDDGLGIRPDVVQRVFDPFERDPETTIGVPGLGLGLAISRRLALAQHGDLTVDSEGQGKGSTFTLTLPLADAKTQPAAGRDAASRERIAERGRHVHLLLIEDARDTARLLSMALRRHMRADVELAGSLAAAASAFTNALAAGRPFDGIVSDIGLPDGSGTELHALLRPLAGEAGVPPAIALSGYGTDADIRRSRESGFARHLIKPVDLDHLVAELNALLNLDAH